MLDIKYIKKPNLTVAYVDNFLNDADYKKTEDEVIRTYKHKENRYVEYDYPTKHSPALNFDENTKKWVSLSNASTVWLDSLYVDRQQSFILSDITRRYYDKDFIDQLVKESVYYKAIGLSGYDGTLISYYEDQQEYKLHTDVSLFTFLLYINVGDVEPGALYIKDINKKIPSINNRLIIIPGCAHHAALSSKIKTEGSYRCCISNFCNFYEQV